VAFSDGLEAFDMHDLDNWIDSLKVGRGHDDADAILKRLE
jgi:hypothetical protein